MTHIHTNKRDKQESKLAAVAARKAELNKMPVITTKRVTFKLCSQSTSPESEIKQAILSPSTKS